MKVRVQEGDLDDESWAYVLTLLDVSIRCSLEFVDGSRGAGYPVTYRRSALARTREGYSCTYSFHILDADDRVIVHGTARLRLIG